MGRGFTLRGAAVAPRLVAEDFENAVVKRLEIVLFIENRRNQREFQGRACSQVARDGYDHGRIATGEKILMTEKLK